MDIFNISYHFTMTGISDQKNLLTLIFAEKWKLQQNNGRQNHIYMETYLNHFIAFWFWIISVCKFKINTIRKLCDFFISVVGSIINHWH